MSKHASKNLFEHMLFKHVVRTNFQALVCDVVIRKTNPLICFAAKSNSNLNILKILGKLGAGADVVSGGEL